MSRVGAADRMVGAARDSGRKPMGHATGTAAEKRLMKINLEARETTADLRFLGSEVFTFRAGLGKRGLAGGLPTG